MNLQLNSKPELILGTAEFGPKAYGEGTSSPPDEKEISRILHVAWEAGIRTLDTADTYGFDYELWGFGFLHIRKTRDLRKALTNWVYHYQPGEAPIEGITRASVYDAKQLQGIMELAIIPFSINNGKFLCDVGLVKRLIVRSVFDKGRLLKDYTVKECLEYAKTALPEGVIVGVNSVKELEEILKVW